MVNLDTLSSLYTSVNDALFALLGSDEDALASFVSAVSNAANPFIVYEAANITALATYLWNAGQIVTEYREAMAALESELADANDELAFTYYNTTQDAIDDYDTTNTQANSDAAEGVEINNTFHDVNPPAADADPPTPTTPETEATTIPSGGSTGHNPSPEEIIANVDQTMRELEEYLEKLDNLSARLADSIENLQRLNDEAKALQNKWLDEEAARKELAAAQRDVDQIQWPNIQPAAEVSIEDMKACGQQFGIVYVSGKEGKKWLDTGGFSLFVQIPRDVAIIKVPTEDGIQVLIYAYVPGVFISRGAVGREVASPYWRFVGADTYPANATDAAIRNCALRVWQKQADSSANTAEFFLHLTPGGAAVDKFQQGDKWGALLSASGDVAMLFCGIGAVAKANNFVRTAKVMTGLSVLVEVPATGYAVGAAAVHLYNGGALISGPTGEAILRVFGLTLSVREALAANAVKVKRLNDAKKNANQLTPKPIEHIPYTQAATRGTLSSSLAKSTPAEREVVEDLLKQEKVLKLYQEILPIKRQIF